jgi:hypothetical protein
VRRLMAAVPSYSYVYNDKERLSYDSREHGC